VVQGFQAESTRVRFGELLVSSFSPPNPWTLKPNLSLGFGWTTGTSEPVAPHTGRDQDSRIEKLCAFQKRALDHALSFPKVQRVVYSTCSTNRQEDEDVVKECLDKHQSKWQLERAIPGLGNNGLPLFPGVST